MKFFFGLLLLAFVLTAGCKKTHSFNDSLVGNWKEVMLYDGLTGRTLLILTDSSYVMRLKSDSTYDLNINGANDVSGAYTTHSVRNLVSGVLSPAITLGPDTSSLLYRVYKDTLDLQRNAIDGGAYIYIRIK